MIETPRRPARAGLRCRVLQAVDEGDKGGLARFAFGRRRRGGGVRRRVDDRRTRLRLPDACAPAAAAGGRARAATPTAAASDANSEEARQGRFEAVAGYKRITARRFPGACLRAPRPVSPTSRPWGAAASPLAGRPQLRVCCGEQVATWKTSSASIRGSSAPGPVQPKDDDLFVWHEGHPRTIDRSPRARRMSQQDTLAGRRMVLVGG